MTAIGSMGAAMLWPAPPAGGMPPDCVLIYAGLSALLTWGLGGMLAVSLLALFGQREAARRGSMIRRRLPVVRSAAPPRSRAGGTNGRVPPRPAAGSPLG